MHTSFADWYCIVDPNPTEELLIKRWQGVENIIKNFDDDTFYDIVRIYLNKKLVQNENLTNFKNEFKKTDQTFQMSNNNLELKILAGVSMIQCFNSDNKYAVKIALAVICSDFQGINIQNEFDIVKEEAKQYLMKKSNNIRSKNNISKISSNIAKLETEKEALLSEYPKNNLSQTQETMNQLIDKIENAIIQNINSVNNAVKEIEKAISLQQEETNILWWLMGEYSNDLKYSMSKVKLQFLPIIIGKELADLTKRIPGPISIKAIANKMIRNIKKKQEDITINDSVNNSDKEWKSSWLESKNIDKVKDFCPMHYAISKSVESGDDSSWIASFEKNIGIKVEHQITPLSLAMQIYYECCLTR